MSRGRRRRFFRSKPPPVLDPVGYRLPSYLLDPKPLPPVADLGSTLASPLDPSPLSGPGRVKLMMSDGTVEPLPQDPEIERRAAYLVRSMLTPPPPPPPPPQSPQG